VFSLLDPGAFERCFLAWMGAVAGRPGGGGWLIAIDGPFDWAQGARRRSFARAWDRARMAHPVSAFACQGENRLVIVQLAVEEPFDFAQGEANEIVAIPKLLALPARRSITSSSPTTASAGWRSGACGPPPTCSGWGPASVALVERTRQDLGDLTGKTTVERQLYIPSLKSPDARAIAGHVRGHWPFDSAQGRGEQPALAAGRQLRRGRSAGPGGPRGPELLAADWSRSRPAPSLTCESRADKNSQIGNYAIEE
jgi:hypothetical protein